MLTKIIGVPEVGDVSFQKRRSSRSIRLRVDHTGKVKVTMPYLLPYQTAIGFVKKHAEWIQEEQERRSSYLGDGLQIGKNHMLRIMYDPAVSAIKTRVTGSEITVRHQSEEDDPAVQAAAYRSALRALKYEATRYLPQRLQEIAAAHGYTYNGVSIKQLRGRWGSCNQDNHITFNIFLMQLPDDLIDYVIFHELAHTRQLHHGPGFWREFEAHLPTAKQRRKRMREYRPAIPARVP